MTQNCLEFFEKDRDLQLISIFPFSFVVLTPVFAGKLSTHPVGSPLLIALSITVFYLLMLGLSALSMYQDWFCEKVLEGRLVPSSPGTDPVPALIYITLNLIIFIMCLFLAALIPKPEFENSTALGVVLMAHMIINFSYMFFIQVKRNQVRNFKAKQFRTT